MSDIVKAISQICAAGRNILNTSDISIYATSLATNLITGIRRNNSEREIIKLWLTNITKSYMLKRYPAVYGLQQILDKVKLLNSGQHSGDWPDCRQIFIAQKNNEMLAENLKTGADVGLPKYIFEDIADGDFKDYSWWVRPPKSHANKRFLLDIFIFMDWASSTSFPIKKLNNIGYEAANKLSRDWRDYQERERSSKAKQKASDLKVGIDFKLVNDFSYGEFEFMEILSPQALNLVGILQTNCVGGYAKPVANDECIILILTDKGQFNPHVTIDLSTKFIEAADEWGWEVNQIEGKKNSKPAERYIPAILNFYKKASNDSSIGIVSGFSARGNRHNILPKD